MLRIDSLRCSAQHQGAEYKPDFKTCKAHSST